MPKARSRQVRPAKRPALPQRRFRCPAVERHAGGLVRLNPRPPPTPTRGCDLDGRGRAALGQTLGMGREIPWGWGNSVTGEARLEAHMLSKARLTAALRPEDTLAACEKRRLCRLYPSKKGVYAAHTACLLLVLFLQPCAAQQPSRGLTAIEARPLAADFDLKGIDVIPSSCWTTAARCS